MALHHWSGHDLARAWIIGLLVEASLVLGIWAWATVTQPHSIAGMVTVLSVGVAAFYVVTTALLVVSLAWYWSRRRVREVESQAPAT